MPCAPSSPIVVRTVSRWGRGVGVEAGHATGEHTFMLITVDTVCVLVCGGTSQISLWLG